VVAAAMCDRIIKLSNSQKGYVDMRRIIDRCGSAPSFHPIHLLNATSTFHPSILNPLRIGYV
jgi:hypothetical protein